MTIGKTHRGDTLAPNRFISTLQRTLALFALLFITCLAAPMANAQSTTDLKASGSIHFEPRAVSFMDLVGTESLLSKFRAHGEIRFTPTSSPKGSLKGTGVVVIHAANGDQLVGNLALATDTNGIGQIGFDWQKSVQLSNGVVVNSTGRFQKQLPANSKTKVKATHGLVVIAIIAILIG